MSRRRHTPLVCALTTALIIGSVGLAAPSATADPTRTGVASLQTNAATDPLGIPLTTPQLSWRLTSSARGTMQSAYQIRVASSEQQLERPDVWDSGRTTTDDSVGVAYGGPALDPTTRYVWQVRVWDQAGVASDWSTPATFETALGGSGEWADAEWIGSGKSLSEAWRDTTITFRASGIAGALGLYFRGLDGNNAYMWQINQSERALRPHIKSNGGFTVLQPTPFPAGFNFNSLHRYTIKVSGNTITTLVDDQVFDVRTSTAFSGPGIVGFRTNGDERGVIRDMSVTSSNGEVLLDTTFAAGDRTFTGGTVSGGTLRLAGNVEAWLAKGTEVPILRTEFDLDKPVASARVYASARGVYELRLNGEKVGDQELAPGWTDYRKRIAYQSYDVTDQLAAGGNAFSAELADGWYSGRVASFGDSVYGTDTSLIAQLRVTYTDGTEETIATDETWRTAPSATISADILDGEAFDAGRAAELGAWDSPGYDDAQWAAADVRDERSDVLEPQIDPPVRVTEEITGTRMPDPVAGAFVYDLGQNMVGRTRVTMQGEPGTTVRIRVAEVLNPDGTLYTDNFRSAKATDYFTFGPDGTATWEPRFTFHGFRYVELTGLTQAPAAGEVVGVVVGTDNELTGHLETSSPLVNQLQSNIIWGQRGNFLSVPTDTPARDERMGWTGDINVFANTANYNMDSQQFLTKWLQDLRDTQSANGAFPGVAPVIPGRFDGGYGSAGWADAGVHVPYSLWQAYGDTAVIEENYDAMRRYVDYLAATSTNHIRNVGGYNDWLNLDDDTPVPVVDTAFVAKSTREFSIMAAAIGRDEDAARYASLYEDIKAAFAATFISADGTVRGDSQTAYILTITNDLIPDGMSDKVTAQFVEALERRDFHLSTGFLGVDGLLPALTKVGRSDIAYRLLQNEDYPSWGYEIGKGATTIWERWNSIMPDGSFGPVGMNSFNHYAYGAVGEWMYRTMAGVSALEPGYSRILIAPVAGAGIDEVDYRFDSSYGTIGSSWSTDAAGTMTLNVVVPPNTTAEVWVPARSPWAVREGGTPVRDVGSVEFLGYEAGHVRLSIGSGSYAFTVDPTLGQIGDGAASVDPIRAAVKALDDAGALSKGQARTLGRLVDKFDRTATRAWDVYVGVTGPSAAVRSAVSVHQGLSDLQTLIAYLDSEVARGELDDAQSADVRALAAAASDALSAAGASLVGGDVKVGVPDLAFPGTTARVDVTLAVNGTWPLSQVAATLTSAEGWVVTPVARPAGAQQPGTEAGFPFDVSIPDDVVPGRYDLGGTASYRYNGTTVSLPLTATLTVTSPVTVDSLSVTPEQAQPGQTVQVRAVLRNGTEAARGGVLTFGGPSGWAEVQVPYSVEAGAGATTEVAGQLVVPDTVVQGPVRLTARPDAAAVQAEASLNVQLPTPPTGAIDHVDLGDGASEAAHALAASQHSGTSFEAGVTRRYTHSMYPGGWFEFDVVVPTDGPFAVRVVETFDGATLKTYDVSADGVTVLSQSLRRTAGGQGTMTYQFVVDEPEVAADGRVRLRFQDVDGDHDPSVADVWVLPLS